MEPEKWWWGGGGEKNAGVRSPGHSRAEDAVDCDLEDLSLKPALRLWQIAPWGPSFLI